MARFAKTPLAVNGNFANGEVRPAGDGVNNNLLGTAFNANGDSYYGRIAYNF